MVDRKRCALCGGRLADGTTTFTADFGKGVFVARHVPAEVCDQCGESWLSDSTSALLEAGVNEARERQRQFEVVDMAA